MRLSQSTRVQPLFDRGDRIAKLRLAAAGRGALHFSLKRVRAGQVSRWTVGAAFESHDFFPAFLGGVQGPVPETRRFAYPFLRFESLEDDWDASVNLNFVALTEDVYLGRRWGHPGPWHSALARDGDRARLVLEVQGRCALRGLAGWCAGA